MKQVAQFSILVIGILLGLGSAAFGGELGQGSGPRLYAMAALDENTLVAVGRAGTVARSVDRGETWDVFFSGTDVLLRGVAFADSKTGVAVGDFGAILRSSDGGQSWEEVSSPADAILNGVCLSGQTAIAVGRDGTTLRSDDSGLSWTPADSGTSLDLQGAHCLDESTAIVVADRGTILRTVDAGNTWTKVSNGMSPWLAAVTFTSPENGYAVGANIVLHTSDGGVTWTNQSTLPWFDQLRAVSAQGDRVIAVGNGGRFGYQALIAESDDAGATWSVQELPLWRCSSVQALLGVAVLDALTSVAVGSGDIERSSDGGATWNSLTCGP